MSIKIKLQAALDAKSSCDNLSKLSFSAKTSFKLVKLKKELEIISQSFDEIKKATIKKYAEKDDRNEVKVSYLEDGQSFITIAPEYRTKCTEEINEALEQEIEISDIYFDLEDFGEEKISAEDLLGIEPFIIMD